MIGIISITGKFYFQFDFLEEMRSALYSVCTLIMKSKQDNLSGYISKLCSIFEQNGKSDNASIRLEM